MELRSGDYTDQPLPPNVTVRARPGYLYDVVTVSDESSFYSYRGTDYDIESYGGILEEATRLHAIAEGQGMQIEFDSGVPDLISPLAGGDSGFFNPEEELTKLLEDEQRSALPGALAVHVNMVKRGGKSGSAGRKKPLSEKESNRRGIQNPFLPLQPRIPDGSVATSMPHRYQNVVQLPVAKDSVGHILLFPGLNGGVVYATGTNAPAGGVLSTTFSCISYTGLEDKLSPVDLRWSASGFSKSTFTGGKFNLKAEQSQWRVVSQGLRLALVNSDEVNDGWFESCRVPIDTKVEDFGFFIKGETCFIQNEATTPAENQAPRISVRGDSNLSQANLAQNTFCPTFKLLDRLSRQNIAEADGYTAAPLKMIGAAMWTVLPYKESLEFRTLDEEYKFDKEEISVVSGVPAIPQDGQQVVITNDMQMTIEPGSKAGKRMSEQFIDHGRDMVYIRIHPTATGTVSNLLATHVANHEIVYRIESALHKHMRATSLDSALNVMKIS